MEGHFEMYNIIDEIDEFQQKWFQIFQNIAHDKGLKELVFKQP